MKPVDYLKGARKLLERPESLCRINTAENAQGESVHPQDPNAVRWCMLGALYFFNPSKSNKAPAALDTAYKKLLAVSNLRGAKTVVNFSSDTRNAHCDILSVFDEAIQNCE